MMSTMPNAPNHNTHLHHPGMMRKDSGSILVLTLMVMGLMTMLAIGVLTVTSNSLSMTTRQRMGAEAFNIAESGAEMGALYLRLQPSAPSGITAFDPNNGAAQSLGAGTYTYTIYPDIGNATAYLKTFRIVSTGKIGSITKKVEIVVRQATFGRFAYFTDKETSNVSGGQIWWRTGEICDGPAHSNNTGGSNFSINYNGSTTSIFRDVLTASGNSISYSPSSPKNETTFRKIFLDGSKGFKLGASRIELPPSTDVQKNAAWGASSGFPTTNGVHLRSSLNGGIYIVGDAGVQFGVDGGGNQTITVTQGSKTTAITVNLASNTTTSTGPVGTGSPTTCANKANGMVYCTGNITSLKGTIADNWCSGTNILARSAWTVATDVNANKNITITDSIKYKTRPDKTLAPDAAVNVAAGTLGLVAKDIDISASAPANVEIDGVCTAGGQNTTGGSFSAVNYDSRTPVGTLTVLGGIIQKARGAVGTFNASTGQASTGFAKNYSYDPRLASDPPPFYPTTGTYERLSWRVLP